MDYATIGTFVVDVLKAALPVGLIFIITERLAQLFFHFAFPKIFK